MHDDTVEEKTDASSVPDSGWRDEVTARLQRYRSKRRANAPRYPSLYLKFDPPELRSAAPRTPENTLPAQNEFAPTFQALAMDPVETEIAPQAHAEAGARAQVVTSAAAATAPTAKILEFPRTGHLVPQDPDALADPVIDRPRILEAPEVVPPPPALGGITIEEEPVKPPERRPGIDMPLRTASHGRRIAAALVDSGIVGIAACVFVGIGYRVTAVRPPLWELLVIALGVPACLWSGYQYLFFVYAGTTIGLRVLGLRLARFDGTPANRRKRRLRVFGSMLSAAALGMGYAWQFLDEDSLAWHERITRTYLTPEDAAP
jgi:uncharacterized RDD family membrane protein YckC